MKIAIISSSKDQAGINIRNNLIEAFDFEKTNEKFENNEVYLNTKIKNKIIKLYLINDELIFSENIDKKIDADSFVFASKHRSKENTPSFAVHPIGNWDKAEFGGIERKLCPSSAILLKNLFLKLNNIAKETNYELTMEATHHGPYVEKPAVFVEIGSTDKEWNDKLNGEITAKTVMNALKIEGQNYEIAMGVGGPHYCVNFNKIMSRTDIAISHICPKYMLEKLDENLLKQAIEKTCEKVDCVILDWKGLGAEKQRILKILEKVNIKFKRTDKPIRNI
ncbi:MAG: D-aminoacyl-tRNA deacylase [Nanoarchaeota archaeon]